MNTDETIIPGPIRNSPSMGAAANGVGARRSGAGAAAKALVPRGFP